MKRLAVINCKAAKQKHPCSVREMYLPSQMHKNQLKFIEMHYDGWILLSTKYGVMMPDDVIEPYNMTFDSTSKNYTEGYGYGANYQEAERPGGDYKEAWSAKIQSHPIWQQPDTTFDFYLGSHYYSVIKGWVHQVGTCYTIPCKSYDGHPGTAKVSNEYAHFAKWGKSVEQLRAEGFIRNRLEPSVPKIPERIITLDEFF